MHGHTNQYNCSYGSPKMRIIIIVGYLLFVFSDKRLLFISEPTSLLENYTDVCKGVQRT